MAKKTYLGEPLSGGDPASGQQASVARGRGMHGYDKYGYNYSDDEILAGMQSVNMAGKGAFGHWLMGKHQSGMQGNPADFYEPGGGNEYRMKAARTFISQGFDSPGIKYDHMDANENRRILEASEYEQFLYDTMIKPRRAKPGQEDEQDTNRAAALLKRKGGTLLTGQGGATDGLLGKTELLGTGA